MRSQGQTTFTGAVRDGGDPTGVLVAATVEDDSLDTGRLGAGRDQLADLAGLGGLVAVERSQEIDDLIASASKNWRIDRMSRVDRNILRLGACELVAFRDVPVKVVINEAVELAKRFGTAESSAFVNGVLDRIAGAVGRTPED